MLISDARDKDQNYILKFLGDIGVRRLTDCVKITPQTENFRPCPGLQAYVRQMVPWIQRCLYADEFREIYDFLVASDIKARLAAMTFAQVCYLCREVALNHVTNKIIITSETVLLHVTGLKYW